VKSVSPADNSPAWSPGSLTALVLGLSAVAVLFWRFGVDEISAAWSQAQLLGVLAALCVGVCVRLGYALRWRMCARAFGVDAALPRIVEARLAGDALGTIIPAGRVGGDPLRIALLRGPQDRTTTVAASVALDRVMEWIGNTCCAIAGVTIFALSRAAIFDRTTEWMIFTLALLLATLVAPLAMLRLGWRPLRPLHLLQARLRSARLRRWLVLVYETETQLIAFFRSHPLIFTFGALASLLIEAVILVEYHLLLGAFGIHLGWPTLMMAIITGGLARGVPVPAGLGVFEATEVGLLAVATGDAGLGFVVGIVLRLHEAFWALVGFAVLILSGGFERLRFIVSTGKAAA
jgi:uncharacterized protein (TIRG00374 family)